MSKANVKEKESWYISPAHFSGVLKEYYDASE